MQQPNPAIGLTLEASAPGATQHPNSFGRPRGAVRSTVANALASGLVAGCDALASHTGFPPESVRNALRNMRAAGQVHAVDRAKHNARARGRPRAVYAWVPVDGGCAGASQASPLAWALAHVRTAWALPAAQTLNGGNHAV